MTLSTKPLTELTHRALQVLSREMGVADTLRFLSQFGPGRGNYTEERAVLFEGLTLDAILSEVRDSRHGESNA